MDQQSTTAIPANGASTPHDLFVLTDEQILEIEPEAEVNVAPPGARPDGVGRAASSPTQPHGAPSSADAAHSPSVILSELQASEASQLNTNRGPSEAEIPRGAAAQAEVPVLQEPPAWLTAQMNDPWTGAEAKDFWNGVQHSNQEAAAYRAAFATPEEARALKELYPGGVNDARAAANRARLLEQIDQTYFGAAGGTPEQTSAARTQLAGLMLREDPAAFREMVFAGLRALEAAEKGGAAAPSASNLPRLAQIFAANRPDAQSSVGATLGSPASYIAGASPGGARHAVPGSAGTSTNDAHVAAYAAFEKAANEDLERTVGTAITQTLRQALPNLGKDDGKATVGARYIVPLHERLSVAVRQDVEAALKGDRQLGEQIAQILSARRFDNETRAQVVRLIDDRARQLVPSTARRVINDWTHATLAAHRGNAARADAASSRREVPPSNTEAGKDVFLASSSQRTMPPSNSRRLDYRKLSDEQILDL